MPEIPTEMVKIALRPHQDGDPFDLLIEHHLAAYSCVEMGRHISYLYFSVFRWVWVNQFIVVKAGMSSVSMETATEADTAEENLNRMIQVVEWLINDEGNKKESQVRCREAH